MRHRQHTAAPCEYRNPQGRPEGGIAGTIDRGGGLIEEQHPWSVDEGTREGQQLLLSPPRDGLPCRSRFRSNLCGSPGAMRE
jgi:hypothetical protein